MSIEELVPERLLAPVSFAQSAKQYSDKRFRELLQEARDKHRNIATGESNREQALKTAIEWFKVELMSDPALLAAVISEAVPQLAKRNERAELAFGIGQLRSRGEFMTEELDPDSLTDTELQQVWQLLLEPIGDLEVREAGLSMEESTNGGDGG